MEIVRPEVFAAYPDIVAGLSTRGVPRDGEQFGFNLSFSVGDDPDRVRERREEFFGGLGIPSDRVVIPGQIHSATIQRVRVPGVVPACDGVLGGGDGLFFCVTVADCVPILLVDPDLRMVAAVHAGWRGTAAGIVGLAVQSMKDELGSRPASLIAFIGPSAGPCCYEVGEDVAARFPSGFIRRGGGKAFPDLKEVNKRQLEDAGLRADSIEVHPDCTICAGGGKYQSHRRDGARSGRMMAVIGFREDR